MEKVKRLPYGIMDFGTLKRMGMYLVDKTMYIPKMEDAGNFLFLIRPRRFELKYLKATDGDDKAESQWQEAVEQIHGYAQGAKVRLMADTTTLHCIVIQARDYDLLRIDEV